MRVRLFAARAGNGFVQEVGQVVEVSAAEARRLVDSWQAEALEAFPVEEPAESQPPEGEAPKPPAEPPAAPCPPAPSPTPIKRTKRS